MLNVVKKSRYVIAKLPVVSAKASQYTPKPSANPKEFFTPSKVFSTTHVSLTSNEMKSEEKSNFVSRLFKSMFSFNKYSNIALMTAGYHLCAQCTQQVDFEEFLAFFDMPDTYYSWFKVTELHIWLLLVRLKVGDTSDGNSVRYYLIKALWEDCGGRISEIGGVPASEKKKQLNNIDDEFKSALLIYDLGILGDDRELSNAVWRRFFMTEEYDFEKIELMVRYIRRNLAYLETLSLDDLITKSKINWVPVE